MMSFSTKGSAKHPMVDKVVNATRIAKEMDPSLVIDGELQADAALLPKVGAKLSSATGRGKVIDVNVLERKITIEWETGTRVEMDAEAFSEQQERAKRAADE